MTSKRFRRALIVVDVQNDFCEGGSLGVKGGSDTAHRIREYIDEHGDNYGLIVFSKDWHEPDSTNGGHIALPPEEPDFVNTWPVHCIQGTHGAEFHPAIQSFFYPYVSALRTTDPHPFREAIVFKGMGEPAYSAFAGRLDPYDDYYSPMLESVLDGHRIAEIHVVGIATDYCVCQTVFDALKSKKYPQKVSVITDLVAGVDEKTSDLAFEEMFGKGAHLVKSGMWD